MKNYKKLFICALSTLFVGAGIGGVSAWDADAEGESSALVYTELAAENVTSTTLKSIVAGKIKQCNQGTLDDGSNNHANGYYTKEGGTPQYVTAVKGDETVEALYFSRDKDWTTYTDAQQNSGWTEFRFDYSGEIIGFSFDYIINGTVGWSTENSGRAEGTTDLGVSEELGSYCFQYKGADGNYYNVENRYALTADNAWHSYTYMGVGNITNVLIKLYHFEGEMLFSNLKFYTALNVTDLETVTDENLAAIDASKLKQMDQTVLAGTRDDLADQGYYEKESGTPRFVTATKGDSTVEALYVSRIQYGWDDFADADQCSGYTEFRFSHVENIAGVSFDYLINGTTQTGTAEGVGNYVVQYRANADSTYHVKDCGTDIFVEDGQWHHYEFTGEPMEIKNLVLKFYHFQGEMLIANLDYIAPAPAETVVDATLKTRNITWADGTDWMAYGTITAAEAGVIPSEASAQTYFAAKSAENIKLVRNGKTYVVGTPNANSLQVDGYGQFYVKPSFLTYPADFEGVHAPQDGDQIILEGEFYGLSEGYNVGITARFEKTTMTTVWGGSASKPDGKYHCVVAVGEYNYYNMENVKPRPGEGLNDGFYFLADKNDAYAESKWTQNYNGQPNTLAYIRDGKKYYTDREIIICKIREANGNELYYLQGYSVGKLGEILKDGDILVLDGIFQNSVDGNDAIVFDDVRFVLHLADRPQTDSLDWVVTLVNPNVTFKNADGTVISNTGTLAVGTLISAPETNPTMPANDKFTYEFAGWTLNGDLFDFSTAPVGQIDLVTPTTGTTSSRSCSVYNFFFIVL